MCRYILSLEMRFKGLHQAQNARTKNILGNLHNNMARILYTIYTYYNNILTDIVPKHTKT